MSGYVMRMAVFTALRVDYDTDTLLWFWLNGEDTPVSGDALIQAKMKFGLTPEGVLWG